MENTDAALLLSALLSNLDGGRMIGLCLRTADSVNFLIEHRLLSVRLPDSWGRLAVRLTGCRNIGLFSDEMTPHAWDLHPAPAGAEMRGAAYRDGVCEMKFSNDGERGRLRFEPGECRFTLGCGRVLSLAELSAELKFAPGLV